jgi:hypothetical protein
MADNKEIKMAKAKVLSVKDGPKWGEDKKNSSHEIIFQNVEDQAQVITAMCYQSTLPDEIKPMADVENVTIEEIHKDDKIYYKVKFPRADGGSGYGNKGYSRGLSAEEIALKKEEMVVRVITINTSYAKDLAISLGEGGADTSLITKLASELNAFSFSELAKYKG